MPRLPAVKRFVSNSGMRVYRIACNVFPEFSGRVYLLLGLRDVTLIDTGSGQGESTRQILDGLETVRTEFGEAFQLRDIRRILITHSHIDHIGGLAEMVRLTGATVGAHPLDSRIISAYNERAAAYNVSFDRFLRQAGVKPDRRKTVLVTFGYSKNRVASVPVDLALGDGDELDSVKVIHTPGHSPGHVCMAVDNILVAGDHVLARTVSQQWPESVTPYTGLGHYLESLEKVRRMGDIDLILGGHEPPIHDVPERIEEIRTIPREETGTCAGDCRPRRSPAHDRRDGRANVLSAGRFSRHAGLVRRRFAGGVFGSAWAVGDRECRGVRRPAGTGLPISAGIRAGWVG